MTTPNKDQIKGKMDKFKGAVKEGFGATTGDRSTEIEGKAERLKGAIREGFGDVKQNLETDEDIKHNR